MTDAPGGTGGTLPLVGQLLVLSALVLLGVALAAWRRWLPYAGGSPSLVAKVLAVTGVIDLILGFVFMSRDNR